MRSITQRQLEILVDSDRGVCDAATALQLGELDEWDWESKPVDDPAIVDDLVTRGLALRYECAGCTALDPKPDDPIVHTRRTARGDVALALYRTCPEILRG